MVTTILLLGLLVIILDWIQKQIWKFLDWLNRNKDEPQNNKNEPER